MVQTYETRTMARYFADLKAWCDESGTFFFNGEKEITEEELPLILKTIYKDRYEEGKDGSRCFLAEYRGVYGIILEKEFYNSNIKSAEDIAWMMDALYVNETEPLDKQVTVILARELGFPWEEGNATDLIVFIPYGVEKSYFDEISAKFTELANRKTA